MADLGTVFCSLLGLDKAEHAWRKERLRGARAQSRAELLRPLTITEDKGDLFRGKCRPVVEVVEQRLRLLETLAREAKGRWKAPDGEGVRWGEIMASSRRWASEMEDYLLDGLLLAARETAPRKGRAQSRRNMGGWYPGIGYDRQTVAFLDKALAAARRADWERGYPAYPMAQGGG
jgi:hypothetical protein